MKTKTVNPHQMIERMPRAQLALNKLLDAFRDALNKEVRKILLEEKTRKARLLPAKTARKTVSAPKSHNSRQEAAGLRYHIHHILRVSDQGLSVSKVARRAKCSLETARYNLGVLRDQGKVKMTGNRATAKWHYKRK